MWVINVPHRVLIPSHRFNNSFNSGNVFTAAADALGRDRLRTPGRGRAKGKHRRFAQACRSHRRHAGHGPTHRFLAGMDVVVGGGRHIRMAQKSGHRSHIHPLLHRAGGKGMPQGVVFHMRQAKSLQYKLCHHYQDAEN